MNRNSIVFWIFSLLAAAASGVFYGYFYNGKISAIGAVFALFLCIPPLLFERGNLFPRLFDRMNALPTPSYIFCSLLANYLLIGMGYFVCGTLLWALGFIPGAWWQEAILPTSIWIYTLVILAVLSFVSRVRELLGRDIFANLLIGRYRKPIEEERIFLFVDLVGSTTFAEEFGDLRAQQFLGALFAAFAGPVRRHNGTIDDYVGDAAIITWPMQRGLRNADCVACIFDIIDVIEANSEKWLSEFGRVPRLRAALHGGPVVTAEIGVDHHKITYFGDTVNTTARLEQLCRSLNTPVLISSDLAARLTLPDGIRSNNLGTHAVRGKGQSLGVMALVRPRGKQSKLVAQRA
ncbi:adenylate cyclase [Phyllobacterium sp. CL33Tsu]|uniref:adenylate/guanylate cyclase domain-containing protein n=1 Tax=Phyllobacterium sp. CL33Tsu TaxID=1798191 RepID=UPI0008EEDC24|nr:adenylate/guanylate cyclase domain-containing protein [Phyllobacterium sp. CL33Tsu]SFJ44105.1 adenylate cyclase [Phyllobacterium sp. CL33Tsu]